MKNILLTIALLTVSSLGWGLAAKIPSVSTLPATCTGGSATTETDEIILVTAGVGVKYYCSATNTWTLEFPASATTNGIWSLIQNVTANTPVAPTLSLAGVPVDNNSETTCSGGTLNTLDRATAIFCAGGTTATFTLPVHTTTGFGVNFPFIIPNNNSGALTLTPTTDTIDNGTVLSKWASFVYNNASGNWQTINFPQFAAFPACADSGGNHLNFTTAAGFTCGTSNSGGGGSSIPFLNSIGNLRTVVPGRSGTFYTNGEGYTLTGADGTDSDWPTSNCPTICNDLNIATAANTYGVQGIFGYVLGTAGTVYQVKINEPTTITTNTARYWITICGGGCTVPGMAATDTPGTTGYQGVGVRWSTIAGDTHPVCYSFNGASQTAVTPSTAITPALVNVYEFDDNVTSWTVKVNGTSVCTLSSTLPTVGTLAAFTSTMEPNTSNAMHLYFYGFQETPQ